MSNIVGIEYNRVTNTTSTDFSWFLEGCRKRVECGKNSKKDFEVNISSLDAREANFDLINIDTSIANTFRRIMISEVPSVAAEYVYFFNNTSVIKMRFWLIE
ncbi:CGH_3_collapsed_G0020920.mRNA.1.CDS.1 [Saccharomyces cerevisiae]|nr:CGH_3_collapsed_G0020920.mRNA.1.CDS.1 [Saccharomyces cerevisiae]